MTLAGRTPLLAAALACGLVAAPTASAAERVTFDVRPGVPRLASPITMTVKAPKLKFGTIYRALIDRTTPLRSVCVSGAGPVEMRQLPDGRFTATLRPKPERGMDMPPAKVWCPGPATLRLQRYGPGELTTGVAKRPIRFTRGAREAEPPPIPAHEVSITVLPGSTLTAWAPGRPDRSTPVTGSLLGRYRNGEPDPRLITTTQIAGTLALPSLAPDPLCPGSGPPPTSVEVDGSSGMVMRGDGGQALTLILRSQPAQLFGCAPPGGPAGTTTLTSIAPPVSVSNRMPMIGVVGDVALPGGSQGGITANLLVNWDFAKGWRP